MNTTPTNARHDRLTTFRAHQQARHLDLTQFGPANTPETEEALSRIILAEGQDSQGGIAARQALVIGAMGEAYRYLYTHTRGLVDEKELISRAWHALWDSSRRFDAAQGRFFAYSKVFLRGYISRMRAEHNDQRHADRAFLATSILGFTDRIDPIATPADLQRLDSSRGLDGGASMINPLNRDYAPLAGAVLVSFDRASFDDMRELLAEAMRGLSSVECRVLSLRYVEGLSQDATGRALVTVDRPNGYSRTRVHQIEAEALRKLRRAFQHKGVAHVEELIG